MSAAPTWSITAEGEFWAKQDQVSATNAEEPTSGYDVHYELEVDGEILAEAERIGLEPEVQEFALEDADQALLALAHDAIRGAAVLRVAAIPAASSEARIASDRAAKFTPAGRTRSPSSPFGWLCLSGAIACGVASMLTMTGRERIVLYITTLCGVLNIALNWALITRYGATGAALATSHIPAPHARKTTAGGILSSSDFIVLVRGARETRCSASLDQEDDLAARAAGFRIADRLGRVGQ